MLLEAMSDGEAEGEASGFEFVLRFSNVDLNGVGDFKLKVAFGKPVIGDVVNELSFGIGAKAEVAA